MWRVRHTLETEEEEELYGEYGVQEYARPRSRRALSPDEKRRRAEQRHAEAQRRRDERVLHARPDDHKGRFTMHFDGHGNHARTHHECDDCPDDETIEDNWLDRVAADRLDSNTPEPEIEEEDAYDFY